MVLYCAYVVSHVVMDLRSLDLYSCSLASMAIWFPVLWMGNLKLERSPEFPMGVPKVGP